MERDGERTTEHPTGEGGETLSTVEAENARREAAERAQAQHPDLVAGRGRSAGTEGILDPDARADRER